MARCFHVLVNLSIEEQGRIKAIAMVQNFHTIYVMAADLQ